MASYDRTSNVPHLQESLPELVGMSSEEVQAFLNKRTGLSITSDVPNGTAFDRWRQALANSGHPELWTYTPEKLASITALIVKSMR